MNEELLYFVWKFVLTNPNLQTISGNEIKIINPGLQNHQSGPDFKNSKIKIEDKTWIGNVEIHVKTSDWIKHGHSSDKAYDSIILHVVYENDIVLEEHIFRKVHTLELKPYIDNYFLENYENFKSQKGWITCESQIHKIDSFHISTWLDRLKIERLERKTNRILEILESFQGDWERTFVVWVCRAYGFKFNADSMEWLGNKLSSKMLINSSNTEALLLGISGLLPEISNDFYVNQLIKDFQYEKVKWNLTSLQPAIWKTGVVRPPNQPALRIVQLAAFLSKCKGGFWSFILEIESIPQILIYLQSEPNVYWETHYGFGKESKKHSTPISEAAFQLIMINSVIPFMFIYGKALDKPEFTERALNFLHTLKPESNGIINKWRGLKIPLQNAGDSQALIELYNEYCSQKKCLICSIGNKLLKND